MNTTNTAGKYLVDHTIVVDHPELRDSSYRPVSAGTRVHLSWRFATRAGALAFVADILSGQCDFASEYVSCVRVTMDIEPKKFGSKSWREVVPRTERTRQRAAA